jgi:hypothetical protein
VKPHPHSGQQATSFLASIRGSSNSNERSSNSNNDGGGSSSSSTLERSACLSLPVVTAWSAAVLRAKAKALLLSPPLHSTQQNTQPDAQSNAQSEAATSTTSSNGDGSIDCGSTSDASRAPEENEESRKNNTTANTSTPTPAPAPLCEALTAGGVTLAAVFPHANASELAVLAGPLTDCLRKGSLIEVRSELVC